MQVPVYIEIGPIIAHLLQYTCKLYYILLFYVIWCQFQILERNLPNYAETYIVNGL